MGDCLTRPFNVGREGFQKANRTTHKVVQAHANSLSVAARSQVRSHLSWNSCWACLAQGICLPPAPFKVGCTALPHFFSSSVSLLTPSTLEGGARSNYQETQHSNFQEKCDQGGRWILSVSGISSICNANVSLSCLTAAVKHRSSGGGYLWQAITSTRPECPEYSNYWVSGTRVIVGSWSSWWR